MVIALRNISDWSVESLCVPAAFVGNIGAALQTLVGGNISIYTNLCERARQDAFEALCEHAAAVGANAVIGLRYDATEIAPGVTEVLCYGTAVVVEKIDENTERV
jgi:uncharacterized protein YbjQ (UPF0145 family)